MVFKKLYKLLSYKELIVSLVGRALRVRYKGSVLGFAWTWLDPLLMMLVFILVFDVIRKSRIEHFPVFLLCGIIPWKLFSETVIASTASISGNSGLIKRVYYPREIFPLTLLLSNGVNMLLSFVVLIPVILIFGLPISINILFLPVILLFLFMFTFGLSLIFATLNVFMRDTSHIVKFIIRLWFFLSPIFYSVEDQLSGWLLNAYMLANPMAVLLTLFRALLINISAPRPVHIAVSFTICLMVFFLGYAIFKKHEDLMVKRI